MRRTHPLLHSCHAKLTCHCTVRYKIEWIYTKTKVRGPESHELALIMNEKERKKERMTNSYFFEHLVLAYTIELMDNLGLVR